MSGNDVGCLIQVLSYTIEDVCGSLEKGDVVARNLLKSVKPLIKKVKLYGLTAFDNREDYRNTIGALKDEFDFQEKRHLS